MPRAVEDLLSNPADERIVCTVSLVEIAIKSSIGKLAITADEVMGALDDLRISVLPLEPQHAMGMFSLPQHHRDPFDRMILATALAEKLPIVTGDRVFQRYAGIKVIWYCQ